MTRLDWRKTVQHNPDPARVIDVESGWAPDRRVTALKKRQSKKRKAIDFASTTLAPLVVPAENAQLIISIMRDLGRALPSKRNRLNNRLKRLIDDGVISASGEINKVHPFIKDWLELIERRERKISLQSTPK